MTLRVNSEIGRLRRVLIHRPGYEIDWMVPSMMERLLFDDILHGEQARQEHDSFVQVLQKAGVQTVDPQTLLSDVLAQDEPRQKLLQRLRSQGLSKTADEALAAVEDPARLAAALITGILQDSATQQADVLQELAPNDGPQDKSRKFYRLPPVPNYFFQRDPQIVLGDRVLLSSMATEARAREPLLAQTVFEHHPDLTGYQELIQLQSGTANEEQLPYLEGGDVLVPTPEILLVGLSERTNRRGIERLAKYLNRTDTTFAHLLVVELPPRRSYMHLDTVFTFINHHQCLAFLPVIAEGGKEVGGVYHVDLKAKSLSYTLCDSLVKALGNLGLDIELLSCGGERLIDQQREQWTDGANAFAIAPGVITVYRRNRRTAEVLSNHGFRVIEEEDVIAGREEVLGQGPTVITLLGHELSRARGGPRCMTMPLERQEVS